MNLEAHFVFLFSIFAGVFTSTVEEWIYNWINTTLRLTDKLKTDDLEKYSLEQSELHKKLGMG